MVERDFKFSEEELRTVKKLLRKQLPVNPRLMDELESGIAKALQLARQAQETQASDTKSRMELASRFPKLGEALAEVKKARVSVERVYRLVPTIAHDADEILDRLESIENVCLGMFLASGGRVRRRGAPRQGLLAVVVLAGLVLKYKKLPLTRYRDGVLGVVARAVLRHLGCQPPEDMDYYLKQAVPFFRQPFFRDLGFEPDPEVIVRDFPRVWLEQFR